jgi:hypothetical protein
MFVRPYRHYNYRVSQGFSQIWTWLVHNGVDINQVDAHGRNALWQCYRLEEAKTLVELGINKADGPKIVQSDPHLHQDLKDFLLQ